MYTHTDDDPNPNPNPTHTHTHMQTIDLLKLYYHKINNFIINY